MLDFPFLFQILSFFFLWVILVSLWPFIQLTDSLFSFVYSAVINLSTYFCVYVLNLLEDVICYYFQLAFKYNFGNTFFILFLLGSLFAGSDFISCSLQVIFKLAVYFSKYREHDPFKTCITTCIW